MTMAKGVNFQVGDRVIISGRLSRDNNEDGVNEDMMGARGKTGTILDISYQDAREIHCKIDIVGDDDDYFSWSKSNLIKVANIKKDEEVPDPGFEIIENFTAVDFMLKHKDRFEWDELKEACSDFVKDFTEMVKNKGNQPFRIGNKDDARLLRKIGSENMLRFLDESDFTAKSKLKLKYKIGDVLWVPAKIVRVDNDYDDDTDDGEELAYLIVLDGQEGVSDTIWVERDWVQEKCRPREDPIDGD